MYLYMLARASDRNTPHFIHSPVVFQGAKKFSSFLFSARERPRFVGVAQKVEADWALTGEEEVEVEE